MDIFVDTNILLDVLTRRKPHYNSSAQIWTLCERGHMRGHISVISFNNIFYIVRKLADKKTAQEMMGTLRDIFQPVALDAQLLNLAIGGKFTDFEDAIQYHSARRAAATALITRNVSHFPKSDLSILTPQEFLASRAAT